MQESQPGVCENGISDLLTADVALGGFVRAVLENSPWWCGCGGPGRLTNSATAQAQIPGYKKAHPDL